MAAPQPLGGRLLAGLDACNGWAARHDVTRSQQGSELDVVLSTLVQLVERTSALLRSAAPAGPRTRVGDTLTLGQWLAVSPATAPPESAPPESAPPEGALPAALLAATAGARAELLAAPEDNVVSTPYGPVRLVVVLAAATVQLAVAAGDLSALGPDGVPLSLPRSVLQTACRSLCTVLEELAPGHSVELRVPPFAAVQLVEGPRHTRGTPAAVVEVDPLTFIALAAGRTTWQRAAGGGALRASGERSDLSWLLPFMG